MHMKPYHYHIKETDISYPEITNDPVEKSADKPTDKPTDKPVNKEILTLFDYPESQRPR